MARGRERTPGTGRSRARRRAAAVEPVTVPGYASPPPAGPAQPRRTRQRTRRPTARTPEQQRRRRRRLLVWAALPVWLGVFVFGAHVALLNAVAGTAQAQYRDGSYGGATLGFLWLKWTNVTERWKAPYNLGTTFTADGDPELGVFLLEDALEAVPDDPEQRCLVAINLAVTYELMGDGEMEESQLRLDWAAEAAAHEAAGTPYPIGSPWGDSTSEELREEAKSYASWAALDYETALATRGECEDEEQSEEEQQQEQESEQRLEDKQEQAEQQAEPEENPDQGDSDAEEERRQQELDQRNSEAEAEAERQRQEEEGDLGGGQTKNW